MRTFLRAVLVLVVVVVAGFLLFGFVAGSPLVPRRGERGGIVGTTGTIDPAKARERGAEIGERAAVAADRVEVAAHDAELTSKIKAKMALDDTVRARSIDVSTRGSVVTLTGAVGSEAERDRAVALARETAGITQVVDRLTVQR